MFANLLTVAKGLISFAGVISMVKTILMVSVGAAALGGSWWFGRTQVQAEWDEEKASQAALIAEDEIKNAEETTKVVVKYLDRVKRVEVEGDTIIKEVPVYVTAKDDERCLVGDGFVRLWNAANEGSLPEAPREPHGGASGPGRGAPAAEPHPQ